MVKRENRWSYQFLLIIFVIAVTLLVPFTSYAKNTKEGNVAVVEEASLLNENELEEVSKQAKLLAQETGWDVVVASSNDARGMKAQALGEDYYQRYAKGRDGIVCLIDMDNREIYLVTTGEAITYLTDGRIDSILDEAYEDVSDEEYGDCFLTMLEKTSRYYGKGVPDNQKIYNEDTGEVIINRKLTGMEILVTLILGLIAGGLVIAGINGAYRMKFQESYYDVYKSGHLELKHKEDRFVNQIVTHRHINRDNDGGSGGNTSTIHTGSDGQSYGGGGRGF